MTLILDHFTERDEVALRLIVDTLLRHDKAIGGYTSKFEARLSGFSLHVKFENKIDVFTTAEIAQSFEQSCDQLCHIARKLLALPDDYEPPELES